MRSLVFGPLSQDPLEVGPLANPFLSAEGMLAHLPGLRFSGENRVLGLIRLDDQPLPSLRPPPLEDQLSALGGHPLSEPVGSLPAGIARLKRSLHPCTPADLIFLPIGPGRRENFCPVWKARMNPMGPKL